MNSTPYKRRKGFDVEDGDYTIERTQVQGIGGVNDDIGYSYIILDFIRWRGNKKVEFSIGIYGNLKTQSKVEKHANSIFDNLTADNISNEFKRLRKLSDEIIDYRGA